MSKKCQNSSSFEHFQLLRNRKAQLDMKGMVIKYCLAFFFVTITVVALSQIGIIGKITPRGGVLDLGGGQITAAVVVDQNITEEINESEKVAKDIEENELT